MSDVPGIGRLRNLDEARAYVQGFESGAAAALAEVRRLGFPGAADQAEPQLGATVKLVRGVLGVRAFGDPKA